MTADPGWRPVLRHIHYALFPQLAVWGSRRRNLDGLTSLRLVYLSFVIALVWILSVLQSLDLGGDGGISERSALLFVLGVAVMSYAGLGVMRRQDREVGTSELAAGRYRVRVFLTLAFMNAITLMGFVFVFLAESPNPYYLGLLLAAPGIYLGAPTAADLADEQSDLNGDVDLVGGLLASQHGMPGRSKRG